MFGFCYFGTSNNSSENFGTCGVFDFFTESSAVEFSCCGKEFGVDYDVVGLDCDVEGEVDFFYFPIMFFCDFFCFGFD